MVPAKTEVFEFILLNQFSMMSVMAAIEPLRMANRLLGYQAYEWRLVSELGGGVSASNGIEVSVSGELENDFIPDYSVVCVGMSLVAQNQSRLLTILNKRARAGVTVGAVSMGTIFLVRAGLLNDVPYTIHWEGFPAMKEKFPEANVSQVLFEIGPKRFTCAGGISSLDLFLHLIRATHGDRVSREVANQFQVDRIRGGFLSQRSGSSIHMENAPRQLVAAIKIMQANIENPVSTREIAHKIGMSTRTLERVFKTRTGYTPAKYYRILRLERARDLLIHSNMKNVEIAFATGFHSSNYFAQCFEKHFQMSPTKARDRFSIV